jgi:hypothetical protein
MLIHHAAAPVGMKKAWIETQKHIGWIAVVLTLLFCKYC